MLVGPVNPPVLGGIFGYVFDIPGWVTCVDPVPPPRFMPAFPVELLPPDELLPPVCALDAIEKRKILQTIANRLFLFESI